MTLAQPDDDLASRLKETARQRSQKIVEKRQAKGVASAADNKDLVKKHEKFITRMLGTIMHERHDPRASSVAPAIALEDLQIYHSAAGYTLEDVTKYQK